MKWFKNLFKKKSLKNIATKQLNIIIDRKKFCAKPIGYICLGNETEERCGNCGHWC